MGGKLPGHVASYPPSLCARSYIDDGSRRLNFKNPGWFDPLVYSVVIYLYRGLSRFVVCHRTPIVAAALERAAFFQSKGKLGVADENLVALARSAQRVKEMTQRISIRVVTARRAGGAHALQVFFAGEKS